MIQCIRIEQWPYVVWEWDQTLLSIQIGHYSNFRPVQNNYIACGHNSTREVQ